MTPEQQAIQILRALLNAAPVKILLNTTDISAGEQAIQVLEKAIKEQAQPPPQ